MKSPRSINPDGLDQCLAEVKGASIHALIQPFRWRQCEKNARVDYATCWHHRNVPPDKLLKQGARYVVWL